MKFRTDITKGGYKILSIHGPSSCGSYYGTARDDTGDFFTCIWESDGRDSDAREFDLIPLDEPKPDHTTVTDKLQYALDMCMDKLHDLDQRLALEMKRNDELHKDAVARVNGLRNDYLADQSAVQPSRVDALEERLEVLEQRTQTDERGVWVTRESLKRAFDATQEFLIRNDRFEEIAEHLGLEE